MKVKVIFFLFLIVFLYSCGTTLTGYDFNTTASYSAPKSNISINIVAQGHVAAGEDIGKGIAEGKIIFLNVGDTVFFISTEEKFIEMSYKDNKISTHDSINFIKEIQNYGLSYDENELQELEKVIKATACGPKGTYMEGQTKFIKADKVQFE